MLRSGLRLAVLLSLAASWCAAQEVKRASLPRPSTQTRTLVRKWVEASPHFDHADDRIDRDPVLKSLLRRPDADVALLEYMDANRTYPDSKFSDCLYELGKLNTKRTFDAIARRLKLKDFAERANAIYYLQDFRQRSECVPLFIDLLERDSSEHVRSCAARALIFFRDPRVEPALVKSVRNDSSLIPTAAGALATTNSAGGVEFMVARLQKAENDEQRALVLDAMRGYRRKPIVEAVLKVYASTPKVSSDRHGSVVFAEGWPGQVQRRAIIVLWHCFEECGKLCGPKPDDYFAQWQAWWKEAEPLLNDDLKLKVPLDANEPKFTDAEFGHDPNDLELEIAVDSPTFRYRDPIRLDLTVTNKSDKPYRVILPKPPSDWMPTMAYGIGLQRGDDKVVNIEPSDFYLGSYAGPPEFETLGPQKVFCSSVCLQYFLGWAHKPPLPKGEYELTLRFDSKKFAGARTRGVEMLGAWTAKPIRFKIEGDERADTNEIFELIAQKTRLPFLRTDLESPNQERRERANRETYPYVDKRLMADEWMRARLRIEDYTRE